MLTKFGWQRAHRLHLAARAHNCPRCPQGFSSVLLSMAHEPAAAMSPENRLEMQSLGTCSGTDSEVLLLLTRVGEALAGLSLWGRASLSVGRVSPASRSPEAGQGGACSEHRFLGPTLDQPVQNFQVGPGALHSFVSSLPVQV